MPSPNFLSVSSFFVTQSFTEKTQSYTEKIDIDARIKQTRNPKPGAAGSNVRDPREFP